MSAGSPFSCDVANRRVMVREDLNVPIENGVVVSDERIQRALPTLRSLLADNAAVMVVSHRGRPTPGQTDEALSLAPVAERMSALLGQPVRLVRDWLSGVDVAPGEVVLCENVRFFAGELENDPALAQSMAALCDVFVMDAFATAHRAHASTVGVAECAPAVCAGPLLLSELQALSAALTQPEPPVVAIVGGSKVSTKIQVLTSLLDRVDTLIVGGGIANTFLAAQGHPIGQSLYEADWVASAQALLAQAAACGVRVPLPVDVVVADTFSAQASHQICAVSEVPEQGMILDIGPETAALYAAALQSAGTIVWNGPVGVFEFPAFAHGTAVMARAVAQSKAYSIAGGGDTIAAVQQFDCADQIDYICTGGGAFLEYLEGKTLPGIAVLEARARQHA